MRSVNITLVPFILSMFYLLTSNTQHDIYGRENYTQVSFASKTNGFKLLAVTPFLMFVMPLTGKIYTKKMPQTLNLRHFSVPEKI